MAKFSALGMRPHPHAVHVWAIEAFSLYYTAM